ncbi:hypothetical protein BCR35DRAFT_355047 [Leucosporidium creatinivorum]|uniref:Uncharacterized protein n=1 Tax=Leucosporidium creatinivorum TaxID=106004 RepID=A0A1Y2DX07_9BASI|nr:hypothetical protein BCR35DRAFT_355047 [Leucosporidium creatinivorum]
MSLSTPPSQSCGGLEPGPRIIGALFGSILLGVVFTLAATYWGSLRRRTEPRSSQLFVTILLLLIATQVVATQGIVYISVIQLGERCTLVQTLFILNLVLSTAVATMCQLWLLHRVFIISRSALAVAGGLLLCLSGLVLGITTLVLMYARADDPVFMLSAFSVYIPTVVFLSAATDLYEAGAFIGFTIRKRRTSKTLVTAQACALPTLFCCVGAVLLVVSPTEAYTIPSSCVPPLYGISILFSLNSREVIQAKADRRPTRYTFSSVPDLNFHDTEPAFSAGAPISNAELQANGSPISASTSSTWAEDRLGDSSGARKIIDYTVEVEERVDRTESIEEEDVPPLDPRLYHQEWAEP